MNSNLKFNNEINRELTEILYRNLSLGLFGIMLLSSVLIWQMYDDIKIGHLLTWYTILIVNLIGGYVVIYWYYQTKDDVKLQKYHFYAYILGSSITAIMLGILGSLLMPSQISHQMLAILIIIGITGASVQNLHASYFASSCYLTFSLLPLLIWEILQALYTPHIYFGIFVATLMFTIYLAVDVHSGYVILLNNIKLRLETNEQKNMMKILSDMVGKFQRCMVENEIYEVFSGHIQKILHDFPVIFSSFLPETNQLECTLTIGTFEEEPKKTFAMNECLALVNHHSYVNFDNKICKHLANLNKNTTCIPMVSGNDLIGTLTFVFNNREPTVDEKNIMHQITDDFALAIANVRLRNYLNNISIHDALTGLYNRHYLDKIVQRVLLKARRKRYQVSFTIIDIDHFKKINDTFGHDKGDRVLVEFSKILRNYFGETDFIFRYGGEEFLIILEDVDAEKTFIRINEFRDAIKKSSIYLQQYKISISAGFAIYPIHSTNVDKLINLADKALYKAKREGRDRVLSASQKKAETIDS